MLCIPLQFDLFGICLLFMILSVGPAFPKAADYQLKFHSFPTFGETAADAMLIKLIQQNKLQIILSSEDLLRLDISYDSLDYINPKTKEAVAILLETAKEETGFEADAGKLLIEVYPMEDEGCLLYFTLLVKKGIESGYSSPLIFEFSDVDLLLNGCCKLKSQLDLQKKRVRLKSSAYSLSGRYYLLLYPPDSQKEAAINFWQEFSIKVAQGELAASFLEEHGNCLIQGNAILSLGKYFTAGDSHRDNSQV